jgi:antitoxin component YwqK of YwqJK toxin-antitoxin module
MTLEGRMLVFLVVTSAVICPTGARPVYRSFETRPSYTDYQPPPMARICGQSFSSFHLAFASVCVADSADQGPFKTWFGSGQPWIEGYCDRGQLHGPWREQRPDGALHAAGRYDHGRRDGEWRGEYGTDGWMQVTHYQRDRKLDSQLFDERGRVREEQIVESGRRRFFDESGRLIGEEFTCVADKPCPPRRAWYPDGTLRDLQEHRGTQIHWTRFYPNGKKEEEKDSSDGEELAWYEDGKPKYRGQLRRGARHGHATFWTADGKASEREYRDGVEIRPGS